jgi:TonB-linked SusC/RagA family outer membrane protein
MYDIHWLQEGQPRHTNDIIYNGNAYIDISPVKGLHLKSQLGLYATNSNTKDAVLTWFPGQNGQARKAISDSRSAQWTITNTAEYNFQIAEDHDLTFLLGQEGIRYHSEGFSAGAHGSTDDRLLMIGNMTESTIADVGESSSNYQFLSFFGRADYNYKNKYFANFTVRNDQSSRFGKTNRSAMFYSGGLMWNMKREYFLRGATWLDNLELRASVGSTGNAAIGNYAHLGLIGDTQYGGVPGWGLAQPSNTELGWEKQIQTNVGFTASFFNRVNLEANFYHRKTKDMLMGVPIPTTTGFGSQAINIGEMSNRGIELTLSYDIVKTRDGFLNFSANYAYNKNKIDELFYGLQEWEMKSYLLNYVVGKSLNYYMPVYAGVDKEDGKPMWYKVGHNGEPGHTFNPETMTKDETQIENLYQDTGKSRYAPHTGGFSLSAGYKGLTLNANFAFVLGKYLVDNNYLWNTGKSNLEINKGNADRDMLDIWKQPGDLASLPAFQYQSQFDTHLLQNASFLRLKDLVLAYELPKKWMDASNFFQSVRFSLITRNLFTVTPFKGADPEIDSNLSVGNYPATRQFMLGIDVTF